MIPVLLTSPTVGFIPTIPLTEEGQLTDPLVSVPIAASTSPVATTTPEPELLSIITLSLTLKDTEWVFKRELLRIIKPPFLIYN